MSVDKKRDRALQRRVRERQAKTGESYQAALQQLAASNNGSAEGPSGTSEVPRAVNRLLLPFSTAVKVLPGQSAQISARPQLVSFWPDRLLIKNADRWDVQRLAVGMGKSPWSSLIDDEQQRRRASVFSLDTWQPLIQRELLLGEPIVIDVTYTGSNEQGECFEAAVFGWDACPPAPRSERSAMDTSKCISERAESKDVRADEMAMLTMTVALPTLFVDRLTITEAKDWIVHDIRVHGKTIFAQSGDLPGDLFSGAVPVILAPLAAKDRVEIAATYVGSKPTSRLVVELSGTAKPTSDRRGVSCFLPLSTDVPIVPAQCAQIAATSARDFLPDRLVIADPDAWIINDIRIGHRCQPAQSGDLPGQTFSIHAVGCDVTFERVHKGNDFVIVTTRAEGCKEEAGFYAGLQGTLVSA